MAFRLSREAEEDIVAIAEHGVLAFGEAQSALGKCPVTDPIEADVDLVEMVAASDDLPSAASRAESP